MIFCIIENIPTAIRDAITSIFTLLQIYTDCFGIDKKRKYVLIVRKIKNKIILNKFLYNFDFHMSLTFLLVFDIINS